MAYYRGDYYRGDYYRGDPFLGALLGAGAKLIGKVAPKIGGAIKGIFSKGSMLPAPPVLTKQLPAAAAGAMTRAVPGIIPKMGTIGAGAVPTAAIAAAGLARGARRYGPKIASLIASGALFEVGGRLFRADTGQPYRTGKRIDYCNVKALRRSMRRVHGFAKIARRTISFTKQVKMKKGRRRAA